MGSMKTNHEAKTPPSIKINLDRETYSRIQAGPLRNTGGHGMVPWVRQLIVDALERDELAKSGRTQVDMEALRGR
jgi:hypothetical protein